MPIKLIGTIILLILVTIFAGVNLDNKCDITFVFYTFKDIPVFMTVIISFAIGAILMLPFTLGRKKSKKCSKPEEKSDPTGKVQQKAPATESKTLFDFKIKREAKPEKAENSKKGGKTLFGKKKASKEESKPNSAESPADSAENTGAPV